MPGGPRLPSGEPRKASQKRSRRGVPISAAAAPPPLHPGDRVRWSRYTGTVRHVVDNQADVVEDARRTVWRLPVAELTRLV
jgi:hypothetical protein